MLLCTNICSAGCFGTQYRWHIKADSVRVGFDVANAQADAQWDVADSQRWHKRISKLVPPKKRSMPGSAPAANNILTEHNPNDRGS